ncbi:HpcH/HpaI aldolase/citrate lyase family protein [Nocardioides humi]|uniref:HpcH/HpaI aldolase/citrate lyase family protein n=1 Tax=Nocardioides humi TaxID=449461 RepID=UPI001FEA61A8|nr:CoA ester lyase [Nocardioides humi]
MVLDLEDSVPGDLKASAREMARTTLAELRAQHARLGLFVRPNALATRLAGADLEAVVCPELDGLFTPKIEDGTDVLRWGTLIDWFEARNGAEGLEMIVPVEMVGAITNCFEIAAASPRVGAMIGPTSEHADIARAVGYRQSPEGSETLYLRSRILLACRQNGLHPLTGLWEDLADLDGLRAFADYGLQLGFRGQVIIHPSHVAVVNEVYTPSDADIAYYEDLVATVEKATAEGHGAVRFRGQHVDLAHADKARDWLAHARQVRGEA